MKRMLIAIIIITIMVWLFKPDPTPRRGKQLIVRKKPCSIFSGRDPLRPFDRHKEWIQ